MRHATAWIWRAPLLAALVLLLTACVTQPPAPPQGLRPPPLPAIARQPPTPPECTPTCSDALSSELESWQSMLTQPAPQGRPASAPTTP